MDYGESPESRTVTGELAHSKGQIDRAGRTLRRALTGDEPPPSDDEIVEATAVVDAFRRAHRAPMMSARASLRSCISSEGLAAAELSQRLKRMPTIVDKLRRLPTMKLSSLQDLGGCRAVFATQEEVRRVQHRCMANSARRNGTEDTVRDYATMPRDSGYRAVHLWTRYRGMRVEIQLRTQLQHVWAANVENLTVITGTDYKSGDGSPEVHTWLRRVSRSYALTESGVQPGREFELELAELAAAALSTIVHEASR